MQVNDVNLLVLDGNVTLTWDEVKLQHFKNICVLSVWISI